MRSFSPIVVTLLQLAAAAPSPEPVHRKRALLSGISSAIAADQTDAVLADLESVVATATPTAASQVLSSLEYIVETAVPANIFEYAALLVGTGLTDNDVTSLVDAVEGEATAEDSDTNTNPSPTKSVYPSVLPCDAPYSVSEDSLRSAIYIPSTFTYGDKPPVILFPGTGNYGYETFSGSFIPLLTGVDYADPVWVNVPDRLFNDAQINSEYAAYAINYIASLTGQNITIVTWSQGGINAQWAFKYWPSTRLVTSNHIAVSPDYAGTIFADFICPAGLSECSPSIYQQEYLAASNYITALRANDGDSGYVPTTTVYSGFFDEIVEPQQGTDASAYLLDARAVGVTNNEAQIVCAGYAAGGFYTHEGMLYNPLSFALFRDALANGGPGQVGRLDLAEVCATPITDGLDLGDVLATENAILIAAIGLLVGQPKTSAAPALMSYASGTGASCAA